MEESPKAPQRIEEQKVPEALLSQLHHANENFREAKKNLESSMETPDMSHNEHVQTKMDALREAEKEIESVEQKIAGGLKK